MDNLIAYCGIDCAFCPAYIATKNNDNELRKKRLHGDGQKMS